ncbi:MAG: SPOR domain-containing protein [Deltaproteobacteria bacterium]|nr:SPOR domain-containing protein [Deltaproteobacteria bacterium]
MVNIKSPSKKERKRYNFQFSLSSLLLLSITFLFVLGWVFSLGIMVGRGFLPSTIGSFSAVKEKKKNDQSKPIKEEELTFYNQLVDKKERAKKKALSKPLLNDQDRTTKKTKVEQSKEDVRNYSVQVAALKDKRRTEKLVERLTTSGYPAYYIQSLIKGKMYYRIRCGPFLNIEEAKKCGKRLADKEGFKPFIVYPTKID